MNKIVGYQGKFIIESQMVGQNRRDVIYIDEGEENGNK